MEAYIHLFHMDIMASKSEECAVQIHRMSFNSFQVAFLVLLSPIPSLHIEIEKKACLYLSFSFLLNEHI